MRTEVLGWEQAAHLHMCTLFKLLGWKFDTEGPKADEFSGSVSALGVVFDLSGTHEGIAMSKTLRKGKMVWTRLCATFLIRTFLESKRHSGSEESWLLQSVKFWAELASSHCVRCPSIYTEYLSSTLLRVRLTMLSNT